MVICEVVNGGTQNPIIGTYLPPSTLEHLPDLEEGLLCSRDQDTIALGDLNSNIGQSQNSRSQQVADLLTKFGMLGNPIQYSQCKITLR